MRHWKPLRRRGHAKDNCVAVGADAQHLGRSDGVSTRASTARQKHGRRVGGGSIGGVFVHLRDGGRRDPRGAAKRQRAARACNAWHHICRQRCSAAIGGGGRHDYQVYGGATANSFEAAALRIPSPVPARPDIVACDGDGLLRPCGRWPAPQPRQPRPQAPAVSWLPRSMALPLTRTRATNRNARILK